MNSVLPFILVLVTMIKCLYQPLQLDQPVSMYMYTNYTNNTNNTSTFIQYQVSRTTKLDVLFCFTQSIIKYSEPNNTSNDIYTSTCTLTDSSSSYQCVRLYNVDGLNPSHSNFTRTMNSDMKTSDSYNNRYSTSSTQNAQQNITTNPSRTLQNQQKSTNGYQSQQHAPNKKNARILIQSYLSLQILEIQGFFQQDKIYHMYTCPIYQKQSDSCIQYWKQNYVQTRKSRQNNTKKINMIVQRKHFCGSFRRGTQNITNHVFYGGTLRQGNFVMFMAALSYLSDSTQNLVMWGGISYSYDHANRDMFCYSTDGTAFDAISLLVGPLYKDTASNIVGTDDVKIVDTSYVQDGLSDMYFIQYHRIYDTGDKLGDERLFRKIYDRFAFAAHFQQVAAKQTLVISPTCLSSEYPHNFIMSMLADVSVSMHNLTFLFSLMIFFIFNLY